LLAAETQQLHCGRVHIFDGAVFGSDKDHVFGTFENTPIFAFGKPEIIFQSLAIRDISKHLHAADDIPGMIFQDGDTGGDGQGSAVQSGDRKRPVVDVFFYLGTVITGAADLSGSCFEYLSAVRTQGS
jgi:hypothetical protein